MTYTFEREPKHPAKPLRIWRIDENGNRELYMENGSPVMYSYGMWGSILLTGTTDPGMQDLIDKTIMYYKLKGGKR